MNASPMAPTGPRPADTRGGASSPRRLGRHLRLGALLLLLGIASGVWAARASGDAIAQADPAEPQQGGERQRRVSLTELDRVGGGLGEYLLAQAIDIAWQHPITKMKVQTCTLDHPRALGLYQRMGFVPYAQTETEVEELD